jgi:hypothetical protein
MSDIELVETCLTAGICAAVIFTIVVGVVLGALGHARAAGRADERLGYREPPEVQR